MLLHRWKKHIQSHEAQSGERLTDSRRAFNSFIEGGARTRRDTRVGGLNLRSRTILKDKFLKMSDDAFKRHQLSKIGKNNPEKKDSTRKPRKRCANTVE